MRMRTLILLYAFKDYPRAVPVSPVFERRPLMLNAGTYYGNSVLGDCYLAIARRWLEAGVFSAVKAVAVQYPPGHPRHGPAGVARLADGFEFYVLEDLAQYGSIHDPSASDVVWIRGEPPWEPVLERQRGSFRLYYSGASSEKWQPRFPVDAVLVDDGRARLPGTRCVEFFKCCGEEVFHPLDVRKTYDVCVVGRFDARDKKGQLEFARLADRRRWRTIFTGEPADDEVVQGLKRLWPSCEVVEGATKPELNEILNRSKVSIINSQARDGCPRVVVESLAAGTPIVVNRRNIARKYVVRGAGLAPPTWLLRAAVGRAIARYDRFRAAEVYARRFHSSVSAQRLAQELFLARQ